MIGSSSVFDRRWHGGDSSDNIVHPLKLAILGNLDGVLKLIHDGKDVAVKE